MQTTEKGATMRLALINSELVEAEHWSDGYVSSKPCAGWGVYVPISRLMGRR